MTVRSTSLVARLVAQSAIVTAMSLSAHPGLAMAQATPASGSIGVSLTILQPVATRAVELLGFSVDRAGMARFQTSAPVSGPASQVVMTTVSSSLSSFAPAQQAPTLVGTQAAPTTFSYLVHVGTPDRAAVGQRPVIVRIQYLAVAGT
ncbi:MAG: hypothetical protein JWL95_2324 [Gemmatimonadetes bacterium]|nr:hypothetical protein [Gemmatimonadota bacterium]